LDANYEAGAPFLPLMISFLGISTFTTSNNFSIDITELVILIPDLDSLLESREDANELSLLVKVLLETESEGYGIEVREGLILGLCIGEPMAAV
jgi:hypothetical protein